MTKAQNMHHTCTKILHYYDANVSV